MKSYIKYGIFGAAGLFVFILLSAFWPLVGVSAGHVGVVTTFGKVDDAALTEGLHLINPLSKVHELPTRVLKSEIKADAASRDLQSVTTSIALNYRIDAKNAARFYQQIGTGYEVSIIAPAVEETVKAVTANYTAEELISKRDEVRTKIRTALYQRLRDRTTGGLIVDDFSITNFAFSQTFNRAIEAKQEAEQLALKAQRDLQRVKIEAEQKIAQAQAEAASLKAQKQEVTPELIKLREIEAQREAIKKWDGKLPTYSGGVLPFMQIK
jgi:regulator of protease activity HflC (stomatin/prohibitin superfamily)